MFNRRNILSFLIVLSLVFAAGGYAFAAGFKDTQGHWAEGQINKWAESGLAGGYSDGTFKPNNQITRAEFVAMVNRAFGIETRGFTADFSDVNSGQWYYNDIAAASAAGYTGGYPDGTFKPQQSISRQEAASIMVRLLELEPTTQGLEGFKDAAQIPQWSRSSIGAIAKAGLMAGYPDGTFQPGKSITRAEAVVSLDRAREFAPVTPPVIEEATLQGTVTLDGKAVSGATVRVFQAGGYEDIKETETDSKGYFEFALATGDYDITAVTDNKVAYDSDITVAKDKKATAKLELVPAAVVSGTLYDENGRTKVKDAKMLFTTNPTFVITTDKDGKFRGAVLPDSTYTLQVYKPGKEDADPLLLAEDVAVGAAGTRSLGIFKAPFSLSAPSGGGGGGGGGGSDEVELKGINITPDVDSITIGVDEQVSLKAVLEPSNTTQTSVNWSIDNQGIVSLTKDGTTATVRGLKAGNVEVKVISDVKSSIYDTINVRVIKTQQVDVEVGKAAPLEVSSEPVKVTTNVTIGGKVIPLAVVLPEVPAGTTMTVKEVPADTSPGDLLAFVGLDLEINIPGVSVTVELPVPDGLTVDEAGAFHYNGSVWEHRDATVINGKLVFTTNLSPVAVSKKMPAPKEVEATVNGNAVNLSWSAVAGGSNNDKITVSYAVFRDDKNVASGLRTTNYTDSGLQEGNYTYYVKAYREVNAEQSGNVIKFESAPSKSVSATIGSVPTITKFAGKEILAGINTINVNLSDIKTKTGIEVSRDSKLALNVEGLGIVKQLSLKANMDNNIYNILIPNFEDIDVSELDLEKLYQATSTCPPATKEQIIKAVNFTGLFEVIKGSKPGIKDSIINDTNLKRLLEIVSADENINKGDILEAVDLEDMVEALRGVITKDDISAVLDPQDFATIITYGDDDNDLKQEIANATLDLKNATTNDDIADATKELFKLIKQTTETTQDAIAQAMNFTALFELANKVKGTTAKAVFDAINFTALFDAMNGASNATISELIKVTLQVIEIMEDHEITRSDILNNIKFDELDKADIFNWLSGIDGDGNVLTIEAILTDDINPESTNTYTININK